MSNPRKTTSAKSWKKRTGGQELKLPSGNICLVKRPGMDKMLSSGIMPDSLTPIALEQIKVSESGRPKNKKKQAEEEKALLEELFKDQNKMADVFKSFDRALVMCVVEPKVRMGDYTDDDVLLGLCEVNQVGQEIPEDERDENVLYADQVDPEDKMFVFQFVVGGTDDLDRFRAEHGQQLATLESDS